MVRDRGRPDAEIFTELREKADPLGSLSHIDVVMILDLKIKIESMRIGQSFKNFAELIGPAHTSIVIEVLNRCQSPLITHSVKNCIIL